MTLAQDKALAHVFTKYHSNTWLNLFNPIKAHIKLEDTLSDFYNGCNYECLKEILTNLEEAFQEAFDEGYSSGYDCGDYE